MGPLGWQETLVIFVLALLIFGPKKLPELGKTVGKAMTEFRRASNELKATWSREMAEIEREGESIKETTRQVSNEISSSTSYDEYDYDDDYGYEEEYDSGTSSSNSSDSTAESSTVSASATQGAESTAKDSKTGKAPEGTVPTTTETAAKKQDDSGQKSESEAVTT